MASSFNPKDSAEKLRQADQYLRDGNIESAREIYVALLEKYQTLSTKLIDTDTDSETNTEAWINRLKSRLQDLKKISADGEAENKKGEQKKAAGIYQTLESLDATKGLGSNDAHREIKSTAASFIVDRVCCYPRLFLVGSLLFAAFFIFFAPRVKPLENVDFFFIKDHPDVEFYEEFKDIFGNDEFFIIAFETETVFTSENLALIKKVTEQLEELEEVRDIVSLGNVDDIVGSSDYFEVAPFLENVPTEKTELEALKSRAIRNKLYLKNLISPDGRTAAIVVQVYDRPVDQEYRRRLLDKIDIILGEYDDYGLDFYFAGWTTTNRSLAQYMLDDMLVFVPITFITLALVIFVFFRNVRLVVLAMANLSLCTGATTGLMGLAGVALNNITSIITPLVMALALCDMVHIFSHMDMKVLNRFPEKKEALASVLQQVVKPCFLTTATTAIGFLSLAVSDLQPIREFAFIASGGMVFEFLFSFFFLPPLILCFSPNKVFQEYPVNAGVAKFLNRLTSFNLHHYRIITVAFCLVVVTAGWFVTKIRVETNPIEYFKENTEVRKSIAFVEERLAGVGTLDVSLKAHERDAFMDPANLKIIEKIQNYVASLDGVDVTSSFVDFLKDMNESFHDEDSAYYRIPDSRKMVSQYLLLYDSDDIEDFITNTYDRARIAIRISEHGSIGQQQLIAQLNEFIKSLNAPGLDIRVTGWTIQNVITVDSMVKGQIYSLSIAAVAIAIILFIVFRSIKIGLLSLVPNFFPIILNFGIMGAAGIPLNTATALIAAVALGIAVDDTIHFLSGYKDLRAEKVTIPVAIEEVISLKGRAILSSSLILAIAFGILVFSKFVPTAQFGILCAIIMVTALVGDVVFLPSILLLGNDFSRPRGERVLKDSASDEKFDDISKRDSFSASVGEVRESKTGGNDKEQYIAEAFSRNIGLMTVSEQKKLGEATVAIPGLGGVGGSHLITLVRTGVGRFHLADFDTFEVANINRQYGASMSTLGKSKLDVMTEQARNINPYLEIKGFSDGVNTENVDEFLEGVDVVLDGIDYFCFDERRLIFNRAREKGIFVVTAGPMGFSSAMLIFSPHEGMGFDEYFNILSGMTDREKYLAYGLGLAPKLTHRKYMDLSYVNLDAKAGPSSSIACQICTGMAATEAVRIILKRGGVRPVPYYFQFDPYMQRFYRGKLHWGNRNPIQMIKLALIKKMLK